MVDLCFCFSSTMNQAWEFLKEKLQSKWPLRGFLGITGLAVMLLAVKPLLMNSNEDSDLGKKIKKERPEDLRKRREMMETLRLMNEKEELRRNEKEKQT